MAAVTVQKIANRTDNASPMFNEIERLTQRIRERAFAVFADRNVRQDWALSDWLTAERELCWPASQLVEGNNDYTLSVALAGFKDKDITVTATPRELFVHAVAERGRSSKAREARVCWSEFRSNDVYRRVVLPADIRVEKVSAQYERGILKIKAPKAKQPAAITRAPARPKSSAA